MRAGGNTDGSVERFAVARGFENVVWVWMEEEVFGDSKNGVSFVFFENPFEEFLYGQYFEV